MDKDRIKGSADQAKGAVKDATVRFSEIQSFKPKARPIRPKEKLRMQ
jgi:hypothetical protein